MKKIQEASYEGNLGFEEMMKFYEVGTPRQIDLLEKLIDQEREKDAWRLVQAVLKVTLKGSEFN